MVLNVACILAQWHEASLLCKGKKKNQPSTAGIVPCGGVLLYQACVARFIALLAGSETISNTLLLRCKGCKICADFVGISETLFTKLGKEERFFQGLPWSPIPSDVGVDQRYILALYYWNLISYFQPGSLKDVQCRLLFMYQDEKFDVDRLCYA